MLETVRLELRKMLEEDVDGLLQVFSDPRVMASFGGHLFDRRMMAQWVARNLAHQARHGYGLFSLMLKPDGTLIGDCGLEHMEVEGTGEVELGYDIRSEHWNRGYATEAASAVLDFAFHELRLKRVISLIRPENAASRRVSEKVGMKPEKEILRGGHTYRVYALSWDEPRVVCPPSLAHSNRSRRR